MRLRSSLAAGSTAEATSTAPEVTTTAASSSTELASTTRTAAATAPVSATSLALVLSSTSTTATVVLDLGEAVVDRGLGCCGLWSVVRPALGAGDRRRRVRGLGLGGVARDDLERLSQGLILASSLLVPLCTRSSVGSLRLDACSRWCRRLLSLGSTNSSSTSIELCKTCVCKGRVRDYLVCLCLGSAGVGLCNIVDPSFLCGERSLLECSLLDLRVCC